MDLGKAKLRKIGINNLHSGVHPQHGVIWTDGRAIYLAPIRVEGTHVQNATSVKLGEFEQVTSVHWSSVSQETGSVCHLCVVHQHNVTVWRVSGALPKLSFKQVRKINVRPIAQGCLWNPSNDVLCLLSRHQCSFYFRHDNNKASYAFPPLTTGKISCGCWTPDGRTLCLCVGSTLLIYRWNNVAGSIDDFTAASWVIPGLDGQVTSISPVTCDFVVVAAEVPLESLCRHQDSTAPLSVIDTNGVSSTGDKASVTSHTSSLMNIAQNSKELTSPEARSTLTLVCLQSDTHSGDTSSSKLAPNPNPIKISSAPLKGVLTPDILLYEKSSQCVVVGSNSQSQLHIYALLDKHLAYCGDIQLDSGQRPKGLCSMPTYFDQQGAALLILVGNRVPDDSGFLSATLETEFSLSLKYIILKAGYDARSKRAPRSKGSKGLSRNKSAASLIKSESMHEHKNPNLAHLRHRSGSVRSDVPDRVNLLETSKSQGLQEVNSGSSASVNQEKSVDKDKPDILIPDAAMMERLQESTPRLLNYTSSSGSTDDKRNGSASTSKQLIQEVGSDAHSTKGLVQDLSTSLPSNYDLEVSVTAFSEHKPSFDNDKLANKYDLYSTDSELSDKLGHMSASQPALSLSSQKENTHNPHLNSNTNSIVTNQPHHTQSVRVLEGSLDKDKMREYHKSGILRASSSSPSQMPIIQVQDAHFQTSQSKSRESNPYSSNISIPKQVTRSKSEDHYDSFTSDVTNNSVNSAVSNHQPLVLQSVDSVKETSQRLKDVESEHIQREFVSVHLNGNSRPGVKDSEDELMSLGSDRGLGSSLYSADSSFDVMEKQMKHQRDSIEALQKRLADLTVTVDQTSCVFPSKYQDMAKAEMVEIYCDRPEGTETKRFLLDNGRLQLEPVKLAFGLRTVELWLDGVPCVLGANIDGYIPMKFSPFTRLHISGLPSH